MTASIYRLVPFAEVRPGMTVADDDTAGGVPLLVDEVSLALDRSKLFCYPPGRTDGQRLGISSEDPAAKIRVLPDRYEAEGIAEHIGEWIAASGGQTPAEQAAPGPSVWVLAFGVFGVRRNGYVWRLDLGIERLAEEPF